MSNIQKTAKFYGVSAEKVRDEISFAIKIAKSNTDPQVQAKWNELFPNGKEPTPEELIETIKRKVLNGDV